jgi:hypothetical protein
MEAIQLVKKPYEQQTLHRRQQMAQAWLCLLLISLQQQGSTVHKSWEGGQLCTSDCICCFAVIQQCTCSPGSSAGGMCGTYHKCHYHGSCIDSMSITTCRCPASSSTSTRSDVTLNTTSCCHAQAQLHMLLLVLVGC